MIVLKPLFATILLALAVQASDANTPPRRECINNGWKFSLGNAAVPSLDFTHGSEYFTHFAKARATNQSHGPEVPDFDDSAWQDVSLPHDWVVDLPFSGEASHSHGYKCVGWKYPANSIGWYRKRIDVPEEWKGRRIQLYFEGIFRDSEVYCNGFYMGGRDDGYLQQVYDITEYLDYGEENVITVRCDASLEEGWFYEGAGIYRNVWLYNTPMSAAKPLGVKTIQSYDEASGTYTLGISVKTTEPSADVRNELLDPEGKVVASGTTELKIAGASEWSVETPALYILRTIVDDADTTLTNIGFRRVEFVAEKGFLLNGKKVIMKGCNLHQDHAGVGSAIPEAVMRYRLLKLRKYGFNAIRSSHNPASPAFLDLCDELGFLVIDENRELGVTPRHLSKLKDMIDRDINHPCIILWSIGNEEWAVEYDARGAAIARKMTDFAHEQDPSRLCTYGNCSGRPMVPELDVFGYNYIVQNAVQEFRDRYPGKVAVGTEETTGSGTRGHYETVPEEGWMQPLNRRDTMGFINAIERGWKFYHQNEWTGGLFYWTGLDYRGEPNPMKWPATGSQFGILDYCGFPKDEAFYLKSWWLTDTPTIHVCGKSAGEVWVYSNCSEVELFAERKSLGRKKMPFDGHLAWEVGSLDGPFTAVGKFSGKKVRDIWPSSVSGFSYELSSESLRADGQDVVIIDIASDSGTLDVSVEGACLLGWGNGNPGFKEVERPVGGANSLTVKPFNGLVQILVRSVSGATGNAVVHISGHDIVIPVHN